MSTADPTRKLRVRLFGDASKEANATAAARDTLPTFATVSSITMRSATECRAGGVLLDARRTGLYGVYGKSDLRIRLKRASTSP